MQKIIDELENKIKLINERETSRELSQDEMVTLLLAALMEEEFNEARQNKKSP